MQAFAQSSQLYSFPFLILKTVGNFLTYYIMLYLKLIRKQCCEAANASVTAQFEQTCPS